MITTRPLPMGASSVLLCLVTLSAVGQAIPDTIQACTSEPDDARRLQCYDREVAKFPSTSEQSFGLSQSQVAAKQGQSSNPAPKPRFLTAKIAAMRERPHMGFIATLDNGQVWMQYEEDESVRAMLHVGDTITITPGALGSFWLVGPSERATKARRVK